MRKFVKNQYKVKSYQWVLMKAKKSKGYQRLSLIDNQKHQ